jgi:hypothetical protein
VKNLQQIIGFPFYGQSFDHFPIKQDDRQPGFHRKALFSRMFGINMQFHLSSRTMTQEQLKDMRERVSVLRRFL